MRSPNKEATWLLDSVASDLDHLIELTKRQVQYFEELRDSCKEHNYNSCVMSMDAMVEHGRGAQAYAEGINSKFTTIRNVDRALWDDGRKAHIYREIRERTAELGPSQIKQEITNHEHHCQEVGCYISIVLRERLSELESC